MKRLIWLIVILGLPVVLAFFLTSPVNRSNDGPSSTPTPGSTELAPAVAGPSRRGPVKPTASPGLAQLPPPVRPARANAPAAPAFNLGPTVEVLVSPHATYAQKQAAWKALREAGQLDAAISELQRRSAEDPNTAAYPAALGQAYLQKCGTLQDVREQGILAMQADKVFDTALNLDPANWEARFTKAVALSYWPANLNKGDEVIQHFQTLIQQQEAEPPQPQFAEPYLWLGDQYQKAGRADEAHGIWQRGASLFPENSALAAKLAAAP